MLFNFFARLLEMLKKHPVVVATTTVVVAVVATVSSVPASVLAFISSIVILTSGQVVVTGAVGLLEVLLTVFVAEVISHEFHCLLGLVVVAMTVALAVLGFVQLTMWATIALGLMALSWIYEGLMAFVGIFSK